MNNRAPLTILHTNDFHDRLTDEAAARLAAHIAEVPEPKLLIDAGDAGGSTNVTFRGAGEPVFDRMFRLGYAAMTVGNRDFHVTRFGFRCKLSRARFPILCANIRPSRVKSAASEQAGERPLASSSSDDEPDIRRFAVCCVAGWRVLLVGLTVPMVTERMWERKLSAYIFDPPVRAALQIIPALKARYTPHVTIALTHIGLRLDRELASAVSGIDLIVGGHSHELLPEGERVEQTLIVQAGSHARHLGIVEVGKDSGGAAELKMIARVIPI